MPRFDDMLPPYFAPMPPLPRPQKGREELVVLLHGLSRTRLSLMRLELRLRLAGYATYNWPYRSRLHSIHDLRQAFADLLLRLKDSKFTCIHFVGHSLGGLLIRAGLCPEGAAYLPQGFLTDFPLGRIVQIAPPNQGVGIIERLERGPWLRLVGRPARELRTGAEWLSTISLPQADLGVIAGTRRIHPLNPSSWINALHGVDEPHDGTVEVRSAEMPGVKDSLRLDASHTFIADDPRTIAATIRFLRSGHFKE